VVVVDGVYSMTGELAPLAELADLCAAAGARLVVDEAHGLGVLGKEGRGASESSGVLDRVDAVTVALSKSLASVGGAIMTSRAAADGIRASAMPYVFSAANDPASVAAALASLRILRSEPERVTHLQDNCALLRQVLTENGTPPIHGDGAVIAVPTGVEQVTGPAWKAAFAAGVYTNAVAYPAVARGRGVLRLTLMATHTPQQLREAGEIISVAVLAAQAAVEDAEPDAAVA
jgi:8-amino-7-oxononanoate synthase